MARKNARLSLLFFRFFTMLLDGHDMNCLSFHFSNFPSVPSSALVISEAKLSFKCSAPAIWADVKTVGPCETAALMNESAVKASKLRLH